MTGCCLSSLHCHPDSSVPNSRDVREFLNSLRLKTLLENLGILCVYTAGVTSLLETLNYPEHSDLLYIYDGFENLKSC